MKNVNYELGYTYVYQMTKYLITRMNVKELILFYGCLTPEETEILLFGLGISHIVHQKDPQYLRGIDDGLQVFILLLAMKKELKREFFGIDNEKNMLHQVSLRNMTRVICAVIESFNETPLAKY